MTTSNCNNKFWKNVFSRFTFHLLSPHKSLDFEHLDLYVFFSKIDNTDVKHYL